MTLLGSTLCAIDDQQRAGALLRGERLVLEMAARGQSLAEVLDVLCKVVEDIATDCYCSILVCDYEVTRWQYVAAPSMAPAYNKVMHGKLINPQYGTCSLAARDKVQVISSDVASDPRWATNSWPALMQAHGFQSCWSTPILARDQRSLGVFALYQHEPASPSPVQLDLIRQFTHLAGIVIERAQGEEELRRTAAFLSHGQRLSSTGTFLWRVASGQITWSEESYRIFDFPLETTVTLERIGWRVHPDDRGRIEEMVRQAQAGASHIEDEHRLLMPDTTVKYLHLVAEATRDQDGQLEYIGAIQDVTERRLAEDALGRARAELAHVSRMTTLGALTASIAHEVNQPLSGIVTNASTSLRMLAAEPPNLEGARETARRTLRDGHRASEVIARLRALFSKKDVPAESLDLNDAVREVIALTAGELQRSRVVLRAELARDLPRVLGDRIQLQQVTLNLLLNAADAMHTVADRPRDLLVRTSHEADDTVCLRVQDAGIGFAPHGAEKLFEPFYTTKSTGMGIGLSVSRSIIEHHHGRLWAATNEPRAGATFAFAIPSHRAEAPA